MKLCIRRPGTAGFMENRYRREKIMRAFYVEADHVPREGYKLSEREASTGRALRGNQIWKISAAM